MSVIGQTTTDGGILDAVATGFAELELVDDSPGGEVGHPRERRPPAVLGPKIVQDADFKVTQ